MKEAFMVSGLSNIATGHLGEEQLFTFKLNTDCFDDPPCTQPLTSSLPGDKHSCL